MVHINCSKSNKDISAKRVWKSLKSRDKNIKLPIKRLILVIIAALILISSTSCSNKQELDRIKKELEVYKSQVDFLEKEFDKLKQELSDLQIQEVTPTNDTEIILPAITGDEVTSAINYISLEEYITVNIGEKIVFTDVAEIIIEKCEFTKKVLPSKPAGFYSYYEMKNDDSTYFHVIGKYKNLSTEDQEFNDIPIKFEAKYQDKYKYTGFKVAEENGGSDFEIFAYAKPLTNLKFHVLIEVPNDVKDNGNFDLYIFNGESKYKIEVK